jgi:hypothetical protein
MPRAVWTWSLQAYRLIVPDEQLDLFACREARVHLVARQLELHGSADRTLCGSLFPAHPVLLEVTRATLHDARLCPACHTILDAQRRGARPGWLES